VETRQKILLGILIIAGGYLIFDTFVLDKEDPRTQDNTEMTTTTKQPKAATGKQESDPEAEMAAYGAENWFPNFSQNSWGRDPFFYPARQKQVELNSGAANNVVENLAGSQFRLTGISRRGSDAFVIVNNEVLKIGDVLEGARLLEIHSNSVVMENNGEKFVVALSKTG